MTAFGTVGAVVAAVGIAIWGEWRTNKRIERERVRSDKILADERALADDRLARQLEHSDAQLAAERAHSAAQLQGERRYEREQEQFSQASAVYVDPSESPRSEDMSVRALAVQVTNAGAYTIVRVEAQFSPEGKSLLPHHQVQRLTPIATHAWTGKMVDKAAYGGILATNASMMFLSDAIASGNLAGPYPVVRWTDRWGTRWENKKGEVRQVAEGEDWAP